jgi:sugar phosphate isomerase/epimerase
LRRISISAWADVRKCAEQIRGKYVFSYKPLPTPLTTPDFNEDAMLRTYRESFRIAREHGCHVEIMMKDLHMVRRQPHRLRRWVAIARRAAEEA